MGDHEHGSGHHVLHDRPGTDHPAHHHPPVKERERRSWRFWVFLVLALIALAFYMLSGDQGGWYHAPAPTPGTTPAAR